MLSVPAAFFPSVYSSSLYVRAAPVELSFLFSLSDRLHSAIVSNVDI